MENINNTTNDMANETTRMEISHDLPVNTAPASVEPRAEDEVPTSTKVKIIAALAIVAIAGYIAYWVQEPVSLKADVLSGDEATTSTTDTTSADTTMTESSTTVADASTSEVSAATTGASVSVDVSLYGFEPATLKIDKGTTVVWTNTSTADQTIIGSSTDGQSFASKVMTPGDTFSYKFDQDATFEYYSTFNPALKATLAVGLGTVETASTDAATTIADASTTTGDTLFGSAPETTTTTDTAATTSAPIETLGTDIMTTSAVTTSTTASTNEDLKAAAAEVTPSRLSKTGPAEDLYAVALLTIAWFNRKKLAKVFNK